MKKTPKLVNKPLASDEYYLNEKGFMVFTEKYHLNRGYCCKNGCKHCPYGYVKMASAK